MKKIFFKPFLLLGISLSIVACNNDDDSSSDQNIKYSDLPANSRLLIETNFPGISAVQVTKKHHAGIDGTVFEVSLENNFEIDFDGNGELTDVNGHSNEIPDGMVLDAILDYIQANYPQNYIVEIDFESNGYEVELNNDLELFFDLDGNFVLLGNNDDDGDDDDEINILYTDLPQNARDLIETHFSGVEAVFITKEVENNTIKEFEVKLSNGFEIEFFADGTWKDIDGHDQAVPDALVPTLILEYVQTNYPAPNFIESIEKEDFGFKVELANDIELNFDANGNFIGIED